MRFISALLFAVVTGLGEARRDPRHAGQAIADKVNAAERGFQRVPVDARSAPKVQQVKREKAKLIPQSDAVKKFVVDGSKLPDVDFTVDESYAGLLPISNAKDAGQLYFWFMPTANPAGAEDLTIWLNGGPGCSSLEGFLQENGPLSWQYGTFKPVKSQWSWHNLTNMIWIEQPVGTGFSKGLSTERNQEAVAASLLGFLKNFQETFDFKNKKIYITGESYAGNYVPYLADAMFNTKDKEHFDVQGTMIYDPSINGDQIMQEIPIVKYVKDFSKFMNLNRTTMADLDAGDAKCGYTKYLTEHLVYPPKGKLPTPPKTTKECELWTKAFRAAAQFNPCFNIYDITTTCPNLWDVLGFPGSFDYVPPGASIYFNRTDVQQAINAPIGEWKECSEVALKKDTSLPSGLSVLPSVIERSKRTIIAHGNLDYILQKDGSLLTIQNMTWNGQQGFQSAPTSDFYVPYHTELNQGTTAGAGTMGITHTERGLTWVEVFLSGHMVPQYQPAAAYRQMEFLLGRIPSLNEVSPLTTQPGVAQSKFPVQKQMAFNNASSIGKKELFGR